MPFLMVFLPSSKAQEAIDSHSLLDVFWNENNPIENVFHEA